jgi:hypothetical protein
MCSSSGTHLGNFAQNRISLTIALVHRFCSSCERIYIAPMTNTYQRNLVYLNCSRHYIPILHDQGNRTPNHQSTVTSNCPCPPPHNHTYPISWVSYFHLGDNAQYYKAIVNHMCLLVHIWGNLGTKRTNSFAPKLLILLYLLVEGCTKT